MIRVKGSGFRASLGFSLSLREVKTSSEGNSRNMKQ